MSCLKVSSQSIAFISLKNEREPFWSLEPAVFCAARALRQGTLHFAEPSVRLIPFKMTRNSRRIVRMLLVLAIAAFSLFSVFDPNRPETHNDVVEHFKYGSLGGEERGGIPYLIWQVLPRIFPQYLPNRPGSGYERFGFVFEPGKERPIGTSLRQRQTMMLGLNCAVCHTGTVRDVADGHKQVVLGMPAH